MSSKVNGSQAPYRDALDVVSDYHEGSYADEGDTLSMLLVCQLSHKRWIARASKGSWLTFHQDCPYCTEHFKILNPEPESES